MVEHVHFHWDDPLLLNQQLTDDELKAFLEKAKAKADAASIPDEPFEVNIADELEKAIDKVLKP